MASLPKKGVKGANLRKWLIDSIEQVIDYLHSTRVRPGEGIMVKETPSGVIVSLAKKSTSTVNNSTGGGTVATGFPDYSTPITTVTANTAYNYNYPVWIFGTVEVTDSQGLDLHVGNKTYPLLDFVPTYISQVTVRVNVCIPIPTGTSFYFVAQGGVYSNLYIFGCT